MNAKDSKPIFVNDRVVGHVEGQTFFKSVSSRKHFLRKPLAIAFDISTIEEAKRLGASRVDVLDKDSGKRYSATMALISERGFEINRGFGRQIALCLREFAVDGVPPIPKMLKKPEVVQPRLL